MDNFKSLENKSKDSERKLREAKEEIDSLDRRRATLTGENQKLRELLHEAQIDRQKLKDEKISTDSETETAVRKLKEKHRATESKLEKRTRESSDLADRIQKLNSTVASLRSAEKLAKDDNVELNSEIIDLKRKITDISAEIRNHVDRINLLETQLHDRDVDLDGLRSSLNNKTAENEENLAQLSKQEQLVHELSLGLLNRYENREVFLHINTHCILNLRLGHNSETTWKQILEP